MSDENSELAGLMMQAAAVDGELAAQAPQAIQAAQEVQEAVTLAESNTKGVGMILALAVPILGKLYPSLIAVYTDEECGAVAASLGPLLAKYGVNLEEWGGRYQEEIGAALVCGPIAWATVQGIKEDILARSGSVPKAVESAPPKAVAPPAPEKPLKPGDYGYVESLAHAQQEEFAGA